MSLIERHSEALDDGGNVDDSSSTAPKPIIGALSRSLRKLSMSFGSLSRRSSRLNGSDASVRGGSNRSIHGGGSGGGGGERGGRSPPPSSLRDLLATPASSLVRAQPSILSLDPGTTVGDALSALASRRVLSAPVRTLEASAAAAAKKNKSGGSSDDAVVHPPPPKGTTAEFALASARAAALGRDFVCFVDVRDVLMSFLEVIPEGKLEGAKLLTRAKVLEEAGSKLESMPLSSLPVIGSDGAFVLEKGERSDEEGGGDGGEKAASSAAAPAAAPALSADSMTLGSLLRDFLVCPSSSSPSPVPSSAPAGSVVAGGGGSVVAGGGGSVGGSGSVASGVGSAVGVSVVRQGEFPRAKSVAHRVALLSPKRSGSKDDGGDEGDETGDDDDDGGRQKVTHIVSQLDAARFILLHASALGPLALKTASELGWAAGKVVTVGPTAPAIEALAAMRRAGVSGLAVVEGGPSTSSATSASASSSSPSPSATTGAMIGSFAVPDLRSLVCEHLGSLALPVGEALAKAKGREFWGVRSNNSNSRGGSASGTATPVVGSFSAAPPMALASSSFPSSSSSSAIAVPSPFTPGCSVPLSSSLPSSASASAAAHLLGTSPRDAAAAAAAARRASIGGRVGQALATASPHDTFSAVLARLVARRVHRLHVVDDETTRPLGVVTLTDVLAAVLEAADAADAAAERAEREKRDREGAAKAALT